MVKKWSIFGFLEIVYFFVISTQGIMGNKLRTLFHKISKNYPLLHWSQFLPFLQSKWWKNGLFLHFLEIVYFFVISTQGIMGNKVRTLFHKISKNYPLLVYFCTLFLGNQTKLGPFCTFCTKVNAFSAIKMVKKWSIFGLFGDSLFFRYFHSGNHGKQT